MLGQFGSIRRLSTASSLCATHSCKLLVVGGGSGGCSVSAKFAKILNKNEIIVLDPSNTHYYQPMFTMIGGGMKQLKDSAKNMKDVLPKNAKWLKDSVAGFKPKENLVTTKGGDIAKYDYMLIAVGLQLNYDKIPGLVEALSEESSGVCSNYSPNHVEKTYKTLQSFKSGNAIFTFPNTPVKCPGAPQKVCYISEHYLRKVGKRDKANITYNTSLPVLFGVEKYANALWTVVKSRNINVNLRTNLVEVKPKEKLAVFELLEKPGERKVMEYAMLHVSPPMSTPDVLKNCHDLVNEGGFVNVNKDTLQSINFKNIFAIGDCSGSPNSKTAASVAAQSQIVYKNLKALMEGKELGYTYNGYASCPLVTGYNSCILAEFDYNLAPMETFPIDQSKELYMMFLMKRDAMPFLYWNLMLNGNWNGPGLMRKIFHLGLNK